MFHSPAGYKCPSLRNLWASLDPLSIHIFLCEILPPMSFTYELSTPTQTPSSTQAPTHLMTSTPTTQDPASEFQPPDISRVRQWCERLADYYRLEPLQLDDLKQLANVSRSDSIHVRS